MAKIHENWHFLGVNQTKWNLTLIDPLFEVIGRRKLDSLMRTRKSQFLGKRQWELTLFGSKSEAMKFYPYWILTLKTNFCCRVTGQPYFFEYLIVFPVSVFPFTNPSIFIHIFQHVFFGSVYVEKLYRHTGGVRLL